MSGLADPLPLAVCLTGPTAAGKTALALGLADALGAEIISVDSAQVYRGLDIGTAKPDRAILERYPHRLIDIRDPAQAYSAAAFRHDALVAMREILAAGRVPLLVGGTMLYFRVLEQGLAALPPADAAIRREINEMAGREGWEAVHRRLAQVDPVAAARIRPTDPQRLQRALEVYLVSGQPLTALHSRPVAREPLPCRLHYLAIAPAERSELHRRIAERFEAMLEAGFIDEVRALYRRGDLHPGLPAIRSVGYRQAWDFLEGRLGYAEMVQRAIMATRQLAKRQLTWLRSWPGLDWILVDRQGRPCSAAGDDALRLALNLLGQGSI